MDNKHYDLSDYPTDQQAVGGRVEPVVSCDELRIICDTVVELAKIRQKGCAHLCVENFAQECLGQLLTELKINKGGKYRLPIEKFTEPN